MLGVQGAQTKAKITAKRVSEICLGGKLIIARLLHARYTQQSAHDQVRGHGFTRSRFSTASLAVLAY
jgi:hypothetical protein